MTSNQWYLYVVACSDESLYTGITTDVERRVEEHNQSNEGARYTRSRRPVRLVASWSCDSHSEAARLEYAFKALRRDQKLARLDVASVHDLLD